MDVLMDIRKFRGNGELMCKDSASKGEPIRDIPEDKSIVFDNFENGLIASIDFNPGTLKLKVNLTKKGKNSGIGLKYEEVSEDNNEKAK